MLETVLVAVIALVNIVLIWAVLTRSKDKGLGKALSCFIATISIWVLSAFFSEVVVGETAKLLLTKVAYVGASLSIPSLIVFLARMQSLSALNTKTAVIAVALPAVAASVTILLTDTVISGIVVSGSSFSVETGSLGLLFNLYLGLSVAFVLYLLIRGYRRSTGDQRRAYQLLILGIAVFAVTNVVVNVILPVFNQDQSFYRYGNYSVVFFTALTSYAIVAHNLFEIRTLATATLAIVLNIAMITQIFASDNLSEIILKTVVELIVAIGSYSLVRNIGGEIQRRHEVERLAKERIEVLEELEQRNKNLAALQKVSKMVLNQIEMRPMVQAILDEIPKQFDNCTGSFLSLVRGGHLAGYAISTNEFTKKVYSLVGNDLEKYSYPIKKGFNLMHDTLVDRQLKESTHLNDFICPPITKPVGATIQTLIGIKYVLTVPLFSGKEPLGVMLFAYRVPKEQLLEKDVDMATAISDEMSLAIQRAYAFQQLKDANEYLADLDKLKDEFISIASHELNTPLAAVEGYLSMILDEHMGKVDDKARVYLTRAYDSSKRLAELILDLLNVSRIEQGRVKMKFAKTNLYDLAESVMHELQVKVDAKKLTLKLEGDRKKVPQTWCDPDRIREVIVNLVGNAIKYTEKGGIRMKITEDAGRLRFEIIDTGRGISAEGQKKLFQKFSQVKREVDEQKGTGLGLYISKNFIELHKGRIWVESEEGKGSDFIFELPLLTEPPEKVDGAILEGPLSAPRVEIRDKKPPAIVTQSTTTRM